MLSHYEKSCKIKTLRSALEHGEVSSESNNLLEIVEEIEKNAEKSIEDIMYQCDLQSKTENGPLRSDKAAQANKVVKNLKKRCDKTFKETLDFLQEKASLFSDENGLEPLSFVNSISSQLTK